MRLLRKNLAFYIYTLVFCSFMYLLLIYRFRRYIIAFEKSFMTCTINAHKKEKNLLRKCMIMPDNVSFNLQSRYILCS